MTSLTIADIDLSDIEFWAKPDVEREAVFKLLRDEAPITFYEEMLVEEFPQGPGYWALTRYADVMHVSRHPELSARPGGTNIGDIPQELAEFLGRSTWTTRATSAAGLVNPGSGRSSSTSCSTRCGARRGFDAVRQGRVRLARDRRALPLQIVCDMVGVPPDGADIFAQTNIILGVGDPEYVQTYEDLMGVYDAHQMARSSGRLDNPKTTSRASSCTPRSTVSAFRSRSSRRSSSCSSWRGTTTRTAISHGMLALQNNPDQKAFG
jgi:cytochrome P450